MARYCTACGAPAAQGEAPAASVEQEPVAVPVAPRRRLRRIRSREKIAGVCAGFAEYFDTDVTLMRIIWLALLFLPPYIGLIAYIVSWAVLPKD
jgi:phage shock protein PspC (stress-responsive transcriptional regulator)